MRRWFHTWPLRRTRNFRAPARDDPVRGSGAGSRSPSKIKHRPGLPGRFPPPEAVKIVTVTVRFAWWLCGLFLALGIGVSGTGVWLWATVDGEAGAAALVPGGGSPGLRDRLRPHALFRAHTDGELRVPIMLGARARTAVRPRARLDAGGPRLTMTVGRRTTTPLPVYRAMARGKDWDGLRERLDLQNEPDTA
ncbi:hypothetical protein GCM10023224_28000 [Streptomonospora halophila]|uniref:PH domain-containing protein n=2 Tax=Streptomonospora halophila TaxID=427369 RepID=A0ABP9GQX1_9ACTN